jgi:hypothetical protein
VNGLAGREECTMPGSPRLAALRVALPTAILAGGILLAGCGSAVPGTSATHRGTAAQTSNTLCASPGAVTGLQISERSLQNGTEGPVSQPPGPVSLRSTAEARAIARTICGLPPIPGPQQRCYPPAQVTVLLLTFKTKLGTLPVVTIQAAGCSRVTGAGPVRWAKAEPALAQGLHAIAHNEPPIVFAN